MAKIPYCFSVVYLGLIAKRIKARDRDILNKLFSGFEEKKNVKNSTKAFALYIDKEAASRYTRGEEAVSDERIEYFSKLSEEDAADFLAEFDITEVEVTVSAFHDFLKNVDLAPVFKKRLDDTIAETHDPYLYIIRAIKLAFLPEHKERIYIKSSTGLSRQLKTLHLQPGIVNLFAEPEKTQKSGTSVEIPEEEHNSFAFSQSVSAETKELFQYMSKYVVTRVGLLWDDEEDDKFSLYSQESLLMSYPYLPSYTDDDLATLEEAGLVRRPERFVLFDESDPEEDELQEVLMNRQKDAIISVVSTMKPYEVEFAFEGCRLTRLGLEMLNSVSDDRGNESFMKIADLLNTLLSPEGFYRVRAHELKMSTQNADGDQLFTLGEELPLREVKSAPETEADDGMPF